MDWEKCQKEQSRQRHYELLGDRGKHYFIHCS
jgi:hypothetical protein